ncbi:glucose-6-phosphate isomerase [Micromonospora craniellae]|uniref:Glucose-6-phosphate isomerase n=1 Tax=Micromonospora craniellae TaxID=2294034 RepID=A0A372G2M0_9ACTN|nr:glucose-6-phosphate isomerase [Micromonospora craniellae]QOC91193.1 glucose-6-phosphate isomerase [Micromonospora craniellae]RFS47317.1 glucose-6-phosphate isomerase [Micromonospora craniellae]
MDDLLAAPAETAGGLAVHGARAVDGSTPASTRQALVDADVPGRLAAQNPPLWDLRTAAGRPGSGAGLLPRLAELAAELADLDHVVLLGTGGSPLASQALARTTGHPLTVLDTTDPGRVRATLEDRLTRTVVVLIGSAEVTPEVDSIRRAYRRAFLDAGLSEAEAGRHLVVVTEPGSPLAAATAEWSAITVPADAPVGGRSSALSTYGLVPCALAGVPVADLLDQADAFAASLPRPQDNPALALGAALAAAATSGRDTVALVGDGTGVEGLGDWVEHLLAGSTGKDGQGVLPVVVESPDGPGLTGPDVLTVSYGGALAAGAVPVGGVTPDVAVNGPLGAHFLAWEYAAAVAATVLGVDPSDRPDTAESARHTEAILADPPPVPTPSSTTGVIEVYAPSGTPDDLPDALRHLLAGLGDHGYLAVTAYLDPHAEAAAARLRPLLAALTRRPVTFGWGPRYLHSTGQYHKGGPQVGSFLQITGTVKVDLPVPGKPYTFGELQAAQAAGDRRALAGRGRPMLHLHLTERSAGLTRLIDAVGSLRA